MNAFPTLLKREWLEAKLPFFWLPLGSFAFLVAISLLALAVSGFAEIQIQITSDAEAPTHFFINQWTEQEFEQRMTAFRSLATAPFYLIYIVAVLFVLLGALYDDRKDRSVLFWKSMPVSDYQTVAAKLVLAVWIAPLVTIGFAVLSQLFLLLVGSFYVWSNELGEASRLWSHSGLLSGTFMLVLGFLIQGLWSLPIAGYLLLISASVPRLTLLWALILAIVPSVVEGLLFQTSIISTGIAKHMEPAALPNFISDEDRIMPVVTTVADQLGLLLNPDLWIGVLIGLAFLYGAAWMRGYLNEL